MKHSSSSDLTFERGGDDMVVVVSNLSRVLRELHLPAPNRTQGPSPAIWRPTDQLIDFSGDCITNSTPDEYHTSALIVPAT